jgi:hypothetical protein
MEEQLPTLSADESKFSPLARAAEWPKQSTREASPHGIAPIFRKWFEFRNIATVVSFGILFGQQKSENVILSIRTSSTRAGGAIKDSGLLAG